MLKNLKKVIKRYLLPYKPLSKSKLQWDSEYSKGKWDYLGNKNDSMKNSLIENYIRENFDDTVSILDLGSGTGIFQQKLSGYYSFYTGVDISEEAIKLARAREDENTKFYLSDLNDFTPNREYDCILFNESLYYLDNPIQTLSNYVSFLKKDGVIIISMWDNKERNNKLWKLINSKMNLIDGANLRLDSGNSWFIRFYNTIID